MDSPADLTHPPDRPGRPWAPGIGLLLLGVVASAAANALGLQGEAGGVVRMLGAAGYVLGLGVAGSGVHRILWFGRRARPRWARLLVTAVVTLPAFVVVAVVLSLLFTITQLRFGF